MRYQDFATLRELHVEISSRCNAACPMCGRNVYGGRERDDLAFAEWSKEDSERVFSREFANLRNILFCGTHGDPSVARDCLEIVEVAKRNAPNATVEFYSNGSTRTKAWWSDLAQLLRLERRDGHYRGHDLAIFSVDGLADTNHLYRRKTNFAKIMENAEAFIQAGGHARWDFLVFKHNEHQVEEAEVLAKKMGFKSFRIRKTSRFASSPDGPFKHQVQNVRGEIEYYLEPPTLEKFQNRQIEKFHEAVAKAKMGETRLSEKILCLYKNEFGRIYVNSHLQVYPCCFLSSEAMVGNGHVFQDARVKIVDKYGDRFNSLRLFNWEEILNHAWFAKELVESWDNPEESLLRCQRTCGVGMNPILSQSQDRIDVEQG
jgi:MoaA/NifB/PqqE/SkfB family radical SAM enzyme